MPPARIVYHHGQFLAYDQAKLDLDDRGVLFADGVYEVVRYDAGRPFALGPHLRRLQSSLEGIELTGFDLEDFAARSAELLERNQLTNAKVYWQITRGPAPRDFVRPATPSPTQTLIAFPMKPLAADAQPAVGSAIVVDDCRWTRCWIKSLMLLPASLAKSQADARGATEAIFRRAKPSVTDRHITEGASSNVFIVQQGKLRTHPADQWILRGITRDAVIALARQLDIDVDDTTPFGEAALRSADEAFACSTTQFTALTHIDDQPIGEAKPGPLTLRLHAAYRDAILNHSPVLGD